MLEAEFALSMAEDVELRIAEAARAAKAAKGKSATKFTRTIEALPDN